MKLFEQTVFRKPKKNKFDLSHERKMTLNMGKLYPMLVQEVVPGDTFRVTSEVFLRFLALLAPVMHRVDVTVHYFFVPNRLVWTNWPDFITGGRDGTAAPAFPTWQPQTANGLDPNFIKTGSLLDHLGFPVMKSTDTYNAAWNTQFYSALPLRAYQLIYDEYYRDQNVEASVLTSNFKADGTVTGADLTAIMTMRTRAWEKDYFTSALPWTQRGNPVSVPISSTITASTTGDGGSHALFRQGSNGNTISGGASTNNVVGLTTASTAINTGHIAALNGYTSDTTNVYYDPNGTLQASSSSLTINALRTSVRLQEWLENNARGGARYIEQILSHFGVLSSDARLQRPEYLGGGKQPVVVSEVLQHSPATGGSTPLAQLAGHGISVGKSNSFTKFFEEHGTVMGIISVLPKTAYQTSLPAWADRTTNTAFYWPEFANLGEQTVFNAEVYTNFADGAATPSNTFGYQSRYADYKFQQNLVSGQFRETLSYWHLGRQFAAQPALNTAFIQSNPRTDIFAVTTDVDHLVCQIFHRIDAIRPMPYFGIPNLG